MAEHLWSLVCMCVSASACARLYRGSVWDAVSWSVDVQERRMVGREVDLREALRREEEVDRGRGKGGVCVTMCVSLSFQRGSRYCVIERT